MDQRQILLEEISTLRVKLKEKNDMIKNLGESVSFFNLFIIPLIAAAIGTFLVSKLSLSANQSVGFFIFSFILAMAFVSFLNKKKLKKRKDDLISQRLVIQKELVKKSKDLASLNDIEK